jgi:uncharacterized delta-60 repeat protein
MKFKYSLATLTCLLLLSVSGFAQRLNYDSSFTPALDGAVNFLEILSDGDILIAGDFTIVNGVARNKIARLNPDGSLDAAFDANWLSGQFNQNVGIVSMKVLPGGKILLGGGFPLNGQSGPLRVRRLNANGSEDTSLTSVPSLTPAGGFETIYKVDQLPNGKILVCGHFQLPSGNPKPWLARYNNDGTYDSTFTATLDNRCTDLEVQPDGKFLVAGLYSNVNGSPRVGMTRFNTDDSVDTGFDAGTFPYRGIELQSDGTIIGFSHLISRLDAAGNILQTYATELSSTNAAAFQPNGKLIAVGEFTGGFGQSPHFNRFNTDGTHDPSANRISFAGASSPYQPKAIGVTADGKVIAGGPFGSFSINNGGQISRQYLARFVPEAIPIKPRFDFDGDGKDDIGVYRPSDTYWYLNRSTGGFYAEQFGLSADKPIAADYDGDGKADIAIYRDGVWMWMRSSDFTFATRVCGQAGDIPRPIYGSDGRADFLVFRPSNGKFYVHPAFSSESEADMRDLDPLPTDKPVVADYDGDGRGDLAVFRNGQWRIVTSNNLALRLYNFGLAGDIPVPADYDGDGRADYAVFRPSEGNWYIQKSTEGFYAANWGLAADLVVPADYDGDGKADIAVFRGGVWYQMRSTNTFHFEQWGLANDIPAELR